jgi:hypothetical protein
MIRAPFKSIKVQKLLEDGNDNSLVRFVEKDADSASWFQIGVVV